MKILRSFVMTVVWCCSMHTAYADEAPAHPQLDAACQQNPDKCAELQAKLKAKCDADPAACEARKQQMAERAAKWKEKCDANPEQCAARKAQLQQRAAEFKAKCAADPVACEQKKAALRERWQARQAAKSP